MSQVSKEQVLSMIEEIKRDILPSQNIENSKKDYYLTHMKLAEYYYSVNNYEKSFFHLTECHGLLIRQYGFLEGLRRQMMQSSESLKWEYLSSTSKDALEQDVGLYRRLSEMPAEWTIVQLTVMLNYKEVSSATEGGIKLKELFISRTQCGSHPDNLLMSYIAAPKLSITIAEDYTLAAKHLLVRGNNKEVIVKRKKAAEVIQNRVNGIEDILFVDWKCLLLGKLKDSNLQKKIRKEIDTIFKKYDFKCKFKQLFYLIAEGIAFYEADVVKTCIHEHLPGNKIFRKELFDKYMSLPDLFPGLRKATRHPVILIIDEHLDIIPWEMCNILKDQAVTRVPSVHYLYALYKAHEANMKQGYKEIQEGKLNYYVINPDGDLKDSEKNLKTFFSARLKDWRGISGEKPTPALLKDVISQSKTYIYCGHGGGYHLIRPEDIKELDLHDSVQFLFGCCSSALKHLGGSVPLMGNVLLYTIAGSACSVGMLYPVMSNSTDKMTVELINRWLPGPPLDPQSLKPLENVKRESDLLRVLCHVRQESSFGLYSNRAGLIARGLPVKLI